MVSLASGEEWGEVPVGHGGDGTKVRVGGLFGQVSSLRQSVQMEPKTHSGKTGAPNKPLHSKRSEEVSEEKMCQDLLCGIRCHFLDHGED